MIKAIPNAADGELAVQIAHLYGDGIAGCLSARAAGRKP